MYKDWKIPTGFDFEKVYPDEEKNKPTVAQPTAAPPKLKRMRQLELPLGEPKQPRQLKPFKQLRENLNEGIGISADIMAPAMLILKRRGIRVYPDGQRVALYHNDRFNMIFPVPFGPSRLNISNPSAPISGFTK